MKDRVIYNTICTTYYQIIYPLQHMQVIPRCPLSDRLYLVVRYIWIFINPVIVLPIFLLAFMFVIGRLFLSGSEYVQICYRLYIYITVNPVINGSGILINRLVPSLWCVYPNVICRGLCLCSVSSYGRWLFVFLDIGGIVVHHTFLQ